MPFNVSKGKKYIDPASNTGMGAGDLGEDLGLGLTARLNRLNTGGSRRITPTATGTREQYSPGSNFYSTDPLQGTFLESGAFLGLDPLGIFDVPQIQTDIERLDPNYLIGTVEDQARRNAYGSDALERELDPMTAAARDESMAALLDSIRAGGSQDIDMLLQQLTGSDMAMPELQNSVLLDRAREEALRELDLGYALPQDVQNLVARMAAGRTAGAGTMGGMGRDIAARDLGLTSLDLFDRRQDRAANLGTQQEQTNIGQQGLAANIGNYNRQFKLGATGALSDFRNREFANKMGAAQFTQGIDRPMAGLDPGSLADFIVGDINQANTIRSQADVAQLNAASGAKSSQLGLFGDLMSTAGGFIGCWVAREVYDSDDKWKEFRKWLIGRSDDELFVWYAKNGERFAEHLSNDPTMKPLIKWYMDRKIESVAVRAA